MFLLRIIVLIAGILTTAALLFKWRYRVMNTLLAIGFLRKLAVQLSMNMPTVRSKLIPWMFKS